MRLRKFILLLLFLASTAAQAKHLVGGEISTKCLGNNDYEVMLIIYRDCLSGGAPFDASAIIAIYDQNNLLISKISSPLGTVTKLPVTAPNNCTKLPPNVCTEKGVYKFTINLPPITGGYVISHQRCCRNQSITNVNNAASQWGSTFTTSIPSMDNCNSSPKFNSDPPVVLCLNQDVSLDLSASEPDGDSISYSLCDVLNGGANVQGQIVPDPPAPPPYVSVPFLPGFSPTNPITSSPAFSIDPVTGILTGRPTAVGQFVFAICATEWRNGAPIATTRRDFQFNVTAACTFVQSEIEDQFLTPANICGGRKVQFTNLSQAAQKYWWNFGDPTTLGDTSHAQHPYYFFPDTGQYLVTLVAEPYTTCADTFQGNFIVFDSTTVSFKALGDHCFEGHSIDFEVEGQFSDSATFYWDMGGATNLGQHLNSDEPKGVRWDAPDAYYVKLVVTDNLCVKSFADSVRVYPNPVVDEIVPSGTQCAPFHTQFFDQSQAYGAVNHYWTFGDGGYSTRPDPEYTYLVPGVYTVSHSITTTEGCLDSDVAVYQDIIEILPRPHAGLEVEEREKLIYDPNFVIRDASSSHISTETFLPNGETLYNFSEHAFEMPDSGSYPIVHVATNRHGCTDTVIDTIRINTPFGLYFPSAFSPNGDGVNDILQYAVTNMRWVTLEIRDRWGKIVFASTNPKEYWNGRFRNTGKELPGGVYSYIIMVEVKEIGYTHSQPGIITLLR